VRVLYDSQRRFVEVTSLFLLPQWIIVLCLALVVPITQCYASTEADRKLLRAAAAGDVGEVKQCLNSGANANIKDDKGQTPLILASASGHTAIAAILLDKRADPNLQSNEGLTALMNASHKNYTDLVKLLVQKGANVNLRTTQGAPALFYAAIGGHPEIIRELLARGAEIDAKTANGVTALSAATHHGKLEAAKALLEKMADPNAKTNEMQTPLILSARQGHLEMVKLLLSSGSDPDAKDKDGKTALNWCLQNNRMNLVGPILNASKQLDDGAAYVLLTKLLEHGDVDLMKAVLAKDFQINNDNKKACIEKTVERGSPETVILLLSKWPDSDSIGNALKVAVYRRKLDTFKKICASGPKIESSTAYDTLAVIADVRDKSNSKMLAEVATVLLDRCTIDFKNPGIDKILVKAVDTNAPLAVLLLKKGANVNSKDRAGNNLLFVATCGQSSENLNPEIVKSILERGVSVATDPLYHAVMKCRPDIAALLLEKKPDLDVSMKHYGLMGTLRQQLFKLAKGKQCEGEMRRVFQTHGVHGN